MWVVQTSIRIDMIYFLETKIMFEIWPKKIRQSQNINKYTYIFDPIVFLLQISRNKFDK